MKYKLIASAPTVSELETMINQYFYSKNYRIIDGKAHNEKTGKTLDGFRIVEKKARFRFEMEG